MRDYCEKKSYIISAIGTRCQRIDSNGKQYSFNPPPIPICNETNQIPNSISLKDNNHNVNSNQSEKNFEYLVGDMNVTININPNKNYNVEQYGQLHFYSIDWRQPILKKLNDNPTQEDINNYVQPIIDFIAWQSVLGKLNIFTKNKFFNFDCSLECNIDTTIPEMLKKSPLFDQEVLKQRYLQKIVTLTKWSTVSVLISYLIYQSFNTSTSTIGTQFRSLPCWIQSFNSFK